MNWIGGKLQRHAKANANDKKRPQKQSFAKARQRLQHGQPPISPPALAHYQGLDSRPGPETSSKGPTPPYQPSGKDSLSPHFAHGTRSTDEAHPPSARTNPLERVKRRLLSKDDWAGISVARPVQMTFPQPSEMHRIGRRRQPQKTTGRLRATRGPVNRAPPQEQKLRTLVPDYTESLGSGPQNNAYSIRIGSNIHRTQTTGRTEDDPELPSDPMLLDGREDAGQNKAVVVEGVDVLQRDRCLSHEDGHDNLLPLQNVLDLSSFDDVKERSSSMVRQASDSTNPFAVQQTLKVLESQTRRCIRQTPRNDERGLTQRRYEQHSRCVVGAGKHNYQDSVASSIEAAQGLNGGPDPSPPRFTIDHQVLLERQLNSSTESLPQSRSPSQSLPRLPRHPEVNPNLKDYFSHPTQQTTLQFSYFSGPSETEQRTPSTTYDEVPPLKRRRILEPNQVMRGSVSGSRFGSAAQGQPRPRAQRLASSTPVIWRDRFSKAKRDHGPISNAWTAPLQKKVSATNSISDENEAWMRYVFPRDFDRIQNDFTFSVPTHAPELLQTHEVQGSPVPSLSQHHALSELDKSQQEIASKTSILTNFNAPIFVKNKYASITRQSETDFLSRLSPMEGVFDERLGPISTYANAAQSEQSFISVPPAYDLVDLQQMAQSSDLRESTTPAHRKVLYPMSQPKLWPFQSQFNQTSAASSGPCTPQVKSISPLWSIAPSRNVGSTSDDLTPFPTKFQYAPFSMPAVRPAYSSLTTADGLAKQAPLQERRSPAKDQWSMMNAVGGSSGQSST